VLRRPLRKGRGETCRHCAVQICREGVWILEERDLGSQEEKNREVRGPEDIGIVQPFLVPAIREWFARREKSELGDEGNLNSKTDRQCFCRLYCDFDRVTRSEKKCPG